MGLSGKETFQADWTTRPKILYAVCVKNSKETSMASGGDWEETKSEIRVEGWGDEKVM